MVKIWYQFLRCFFKISFFLTIHNINNFSQIFSYLLTSKYSIMIELQHNYTLSTKKENNFIMIENKIKILWQLSSNNWLDAIDLLNKRKICSNWNKITYVLMKILFFRLIITCISLLAWRQLLSFWWWYKQVDIYSIRCNVSIV